MGGPKDIPVLFYFFHQKKDLTRKLQFSNVTGNMKYPNNLIAFAGGRISNSGIFLSGAFSRSRLHMK